MGSRNVPTPCDWINRTARGGGLQLRVGNTRHDIQLFGDSTLRVDAWEEYFIPGRGPLGTYDERGNEEYDAGTTGIRDVGYFTTISGGGGPLASSIPMRPTLQNQVSTGFALGRHGNFTHNQTVILKQVYDRINQKDCVDFVNRILAEHRVPEKVNELWKLTNKAILNRWKSNLTANEIGISEGRMSNIRSGFNGRGVAVTLSDETRIYLSGKMFLREANDSTFSIFLGLSTGENRDTAGRLVHELFHVAGIHHPKKDGYDFDAEIHKNCGLPNTNF